MAAILGHRRAVVCRPLVDADETLIGMDLITRPQLESRHSFAVDAHQVQAVARDLNFDLLDEPAVATGQERSLPARL
jgi:hypothetical protein